MKVHRPWSAVGIFAAGEGRGRAGPVCRCGSPVVLGAETLTSGRPAPSGAFSLTGSFLAQATMLNAIAQLMRGTRTMPHQPRVFYFVAPAQLRSGLSYRNGRLECRGD